MGAGTVRARARACSDKKNSNKQNKAKQNKTTKQNRIKQKNKRTMGAGCRYGKGKGSIVKDKKTK